MPVSFRTLLALTLLSIGPMVLGANLAGVIHKPSVDVHGAPDFASPTVATLKRDAPVSVSGQQGLWYRLQLPSGKSGYVRVNEVRMAYAGKENSSANLGALSLSELAKRLEHGARSGTLGAEAPMIVAELKRTFARVQQELNALLTKSAA